MQFCLPNEMSMPSFSKGNWQVQSPSEHQRHVEIGFAHTFPELVSGFILLGKSGELRILLRTLLHNPPLSSLSSVQYGGDEKTMF